MYQNVSQNTFPTYLASYAQPHCSSKYKNQNPWRWCPIKGQWLIESPLSSSYKSLIDLEVKPIAKRISLPIPSHHISSKASDESSWVCIQEPYIIPIIGYAKTTLIKFLIKQILHPEFANTSSQSPKWYQSLHFNSLEWAFKMSDFSLSLFKKESLMLLQVFWIDENVI